MLQRRRGAAAALLASVLPLRSLGDVGLGGAPGFGGKNWWGGRIRAVAPIPRGRFAFICPGILHPSLASSSWGDRSLEMARRASGAKPPVRILALRGIKMGFWEGVKGRQLPSAQPVGKGTTAGAGGHQKPLAAGAVPPLLKTQGGKP